MKNQPKTLEEICLALKIMREKPASRRRFPKQLWDAIFELTKIYSHQEICRRLKVQPAYLKQKIQKSQNHSNDLEFQEIVCKPVEGCFTDTVVIELISASGLKAKIQGPSSCLKHLSELFAR